MPQRLDDRQPRHPTRGEEPRGYRDGERRTGRRRDAAAGEVEVDLPAELVREVEAPPDDREHHADREPAAEAEHADARRLRDHRARDLGARRPRGTEERKLPAAIE